MWEACNAMVGRYEGLGHDAVPGACMGNLAARTNVYVYLCIFVCTFVTGQWYPLCLYLVLMLLWTMMLQKFPS